ncbi:MAG: DUF814 domain-containing protein [Candidatus Cloacimonetes bacterium]|jgi:predicted ribosome quality control (RQC) complex YloA/Tae2 family protein|nr:DUF814 domain-containing protein [Candidatus Cloacimonadota bacterium]MBT6994844.1 DUF814 domain-containing protein [Candidatus Cloacimonadota bacterium]MBT7469208.1 DUF814 domain-containing protein [Candidatus Cloacimonadota bacterium]
MKYKYLADWATSQTEKLVFKEVKKFEDQIAIIFKKTKKFLQINLASEDSFCFFTENKELPFESAKMYSNFNIHLASSHLQKIEISDSDRIVFFHFEKVDIYGQKVRYRLIIELISHYQNVILERDVIIDCKKKISFAENRHRQILPNLEYAQPNSIYKNEKEKINFPVAINAQNKLVENAEITPNFKCMNLLFEELYYNHILQNKVIKIKSQKIAVIQKQIKKKSRKITKLEAELLIAKDEEKWKQLAELLKANFSKIKRGATSILLKNYYESAFPKIEIVLFADKNAQQNIDYYFKKYRKARDGKVKIAQQIQVTQNEIIELERDVFDVEESDISSLRSSDSKIVKKQKKNYKKIWISEDWEIFIGRTSSENDLLTTKLAKPHDWWFHTRIFRGTHIILRNYKKQDLPENLKLICCKLAAYFSKAKKSSNVPVDFTQIRYVRKPKGSPAGYVIYQNQKTIYVDPISMREAVKIIDNFKR